MRLSKAVFLFTAATVVFAPQARAQFGSGIVFDPTQSAHAIQQIEQGSQTLQTAEQIYTSTYKTMTQVIAAYNLAYAMSRLPQDLAARYESDFSMWSNLTNPTLSASNTSAATSAWINALDLGNPTRANSAYTGAVIQLQSSSLSSSDAATQKLANLDSDTYSTNPGQQTQSALLGKINSATLLQVHSQQDANQILAAAAAQQALDAKEELDERNRLMNESIYFQQNFPTLMQNLTSGVSDSIHAISLSPTGN